MINFSLKQMCAYLRYSLSYKYSMCNRYNKWTNIFIKNIKHWNSIFNVWKAWSKEVTFILSNRTTSRSCDYKGILNYFVIICLLMMISYYLQSIQTLSTTYHLNVKRLQVILNRANHPKVSFVNEHNLNKSMP